MNKIKNILPKVLKKVISKRHDPILSNFFSLGFIQGTNFLLIIITFPYLVRTIGIENFGIVSFLQTIMIYFTIFSDYGFNLSATKDISIERNDINKLSRIYSEVITTKIILVVISFVFLIASLLIVNTFNKYFLITVLSFSIVIGQVLQPTWFFQGMEKMKYITYINILSRSLYAIGVFTLINNEKDFIFVNFLSGATAIVGGAISIYIVHRKFKIEYNRPSFGAIKNQLLEGRSIFLSSASVTIANNANIVILGLFANTLTLGYYSIAEKIFVILRTFAVILYQVVYPRICILASISFSELSLFLNKLFKIILATFFPLSLICFFLTDQIIFMIAGEHISEAAVILKIVCFAPLLAALNIPVAQTMLAYKLTKQFAYIVSIGAIINISLNLVLAYYFQATGTALSIITTEAVITALLYISIYKKFPQYSFFTKQNYSSL